MEPRKRSAPWSVVPAPELNRPGRTLTFFAPKSMALMYAASRKQNDGVPSSGVLRVGVAVGAVGAVIFAGPSWRKEPCQAHELFSVDPEE